MWGKGEKEEVDDYAIVSEAVPLFFTSGSYKIFIAPLIFPSLFSENKRAGASFSFFDYLNLVSYLGSDEKKKRIYTQLISQHLFFDMFFLCFLLACFVGNSRAFTLRVSGRERKKMPPCQW